MNTTLDILAAYLLRLAPGLVLGTIMLFLARRQPLLRIVLYLALFILFRDAMTPLGLWSFGSEGLFWIRLHSDPSFLVLFGVVCLGISLGLYYIDRENRSLFQWTRGSVSLGVLWGIGGALVVVAPLAAAYQYTPIENRGGQVPVQIIPAILVFALLGNLFEEAHFRGYVYGLLAQRMAPIQAGISSGFVFAFCHIYLATTVTRVGYPFFFSHCGKA
jgi:uncharacterized protein